MRTLSTVAIVIPCRNEKDYIGKCLDSFIDQTYPQELIQVYVADGMSDDGTRDILMEYKKNHKNINIIDNKRRSAPTGMNLGIKSSNSDIIIIFGAHAYADKHFVEENVKLLQNEEVGCAGGPIETINGDDKGKAISVVMSSPFGVGNATFRYAKTEMYVDTLAFGAYPKKVLEDIGYFDEELVRNQDDELNYRVIKNGYKILLSPKVKSYYYSRSSIKKVWKQYYQYGFWKVRVMQKHGKPASIRHLIPMLFVITNILGAVLSAFFKPVLYLWGLEVGLYLIGILISSIKLTKGNIKLLRYIPVIFPILHVSYGLGFLQGFWAFYIGKSKKYLEKNTKMSR